MNRTLTNFLLVILASIPVMLSAQSDTYLSSITATTSDDGNHIKLQWTEDTTKLYTVYRKDLGDATWNLLQSNLETGAYTDLTSNIGAAYEYRVLKSPGATVYHYIYAGIEVPKTEHRGRLLLLVDDTHIPTLQPKIDRWISDAEGDGWVVIQKNISRTMPVPDVKQEIQDEYLGDGLDAVFLLGHIPVPYSGRIVPDGHTNNHYGAWAADMYYADMDEVWTDATVTTTGQPARTTNVPGDGKFDQSSINNTELELGRVDFYDMPAFTESELELLEKYLDKNHEFKIKNIVPKMQAIGKDNFSYGFDSNPDINFPPMVGAENYSTANYRSSLLNDSYIWSYGAGSGSYTSAGGVSTTANMAVDSLQGIFTILFGSYFGDWDVGNNFLRAALGSGTVLTNCWSARPYWIFFHMGLGTTIGYQTRLSQSQLDFGYNSSYKYIHVALMGDPTLRMHMVYPVENMTLALSGGDVLLSWNEHPLATDIVQYNVYKRYDLNEPYVLAGAVPVGSTSYLDTDVNAPGNVYYMVRAEQLEMTPSGSFYNQSIGNPDSIYVESICDANAGVVSAFPMSVCAGGSVEAFVEDNNTATGYNQGLLLVDESGVVIDVAPDGTFGVFDLTESCREYNIYSYNGLEAIPAVGTAIDCSLGCCNITSFTVNTYDTEPPVINTTLPDVSVACFTDVPPMSDLTWVDNCDGTGTVSGTEILTGDLCNATLLRVWEYIDNCGNIALAEQFINVSDNIPPTISAPADGTYQCLSEVPPIPDLAWVDNCGNTGFVSGIETNDGGTCPATIIRLWEVADPCGNLSSVIQTITVADDTSPVFDTPPVDITVACASDVSPPVDLGWTDNCDGGGVVPGIESTNGESCPEVITRIWTYTDACGNMILTTQRVNIVPGAPSYADLLLDGCSVDSQAEVDAIYSDWQSVFLNSLTGCYVLGTVIADVAPDFAMGGVANFSVTAINNCGDVVTNVSSFTLEPCICTATYNYSVEPICSNTAPSFLLDPDCLQGSLSASCLDLYLYAPGGIPSLAPVDFDPLASLSGVGTFPLSNDGLVFETFVGNLNGITVCQDLEGVSVLQNLGDQPAEVTYFILPWVNYINGNNDNVSEYNNIHPGACPVLRYEVVVSPDSTDTCISCSAPLEGAIPDQGVLIGDKEVNNQSGYISDINVHIDIDHTWVGDLIITLAHEDSSVILFNSVCGNDNISATFDDGATVLGASLCEDSIAVSGFVLPVEALSAFHGLDPNGNWTLTVSDNLALDNGTLNYWCLDITTEPCVDSLTLSGINNTTNINLAGIQINSTENITVPGQVEYSAGVEINLDPTFEVELGADFHAYIEGCGTVVIDPRNHSGKSGFKAINTGRILPKRK